ncbi:MAG TPA: hypothetical protein VJ596_09900 [Gemmatimonadaceae bacterium]|nr:hypothetical protein [Gemmatimonadaceae bacterium]
MSTPGSGPDAVGSGDEAAGRPAPPASSPDAPSQPARRKSGVFRWRGIIPLALLLALIAVGYLLFADRFAEETAEEVATELLGAQVDLASLRILESETSIDLRGLQIADPFDRMRNLIEASAIRVELEPLPLLEKKYVVRRLSISEVRTGTRRTTAARPVSGGGFAPAALREIARWRDQFDVPLLRLTPIDTIRSLVLDPTQLTTVKRALELRTDADSLRRSLEAGFQGLRLRETLDSARSVADRLGNANPLRLGIAGTRQAVTDVRRTIDEINAAKRRVEDLKRAAEASIDTLEAGVRGLDAARRADYEFARGLLRLPTFDAPEIGSALFGKVTVDRFQDAMYWTQLAQRYLPPGLRPRPTPGPKRLRASGTTVQFVTRETYPTFLLRRGDIDFRLGGSSLASGTYRASVSNLTSAPSLVGAPTTFQLSRTGGASGVSLRAGGVLDHRTARARDSVAVSAIGIPLPGFDLPGLPFRLEPGRGRSEIIFARVADRFAGRWVLRSSDIAWLRDSARTLPLNRLEEIVYRVVSGLNDLEIAATVQGTLTSPSVRVSSNLDRAIASRVRAVLGEEIARAETRVRAAVDSIVRERVEPVRTQVRTLQADAEQRITEARTRLDEERARLEERLRELTGGAIRVPGLPQ